MMSCYCEAWCKQVALWMWPRRANNRAALELCSGTCKWTDGLSIWMKEICNDIQIWFGQQDVVRSQSESLCFDGILLRCIHILYLLYLMERFEKGSLERVYLYIPTLTIYGSGHHSSRKLLLLVKLCCWCGTAALGFGGCNFFSNKLTPGRMESFCDGLVSSMDEPPTISEIMHEVLCESVWRNRFCSQLINAHFGSSIASLSYWIYLW